MSAGSTVMVPLPLAAGDLGACQAILRQGSKSFAAASLALPRSLRASAAAVYAFCRVADDAVDLSDDPAAGVQALTERLDRIYARTPDNDPVDRAFSEVVARHRIPVAIPQGLLEGFQWDAEGRRYETAEDLEAYCARVASTVGVMMTLLLGPRSPDILARACDLGLAMQITNICRDVGEDARAGRLYLPRQDLIAAGLDPEAWLARPRHCEALRTVVRGLLERADGYYQRSDSGIRQLPQASRWAIRAARLIYADIGRVIARHRYNAVDRRAYTRAGRKAWLLLRSLGAVFWRSRPCALPAPSTCQFLVGAVEREDALKR